APALVGNVALNNARALANPLVGGFAALFHVEIGIYGLGQEVPRPGDACSVHRATPRLWKRRTPLPAMDAMRALRLLGNNETAYHSPRHGFTLIPPRIALPCPRSCRALVMRDRRPVAIGF